MKALVRRGLRPHSFCYFSDILWSDLESLSFIFLVQFLEIATKQLMVFTVTSSDCKVKKGEVLRIFHGA